MLSDSRWRIETKKETSNAKFLRHISPVPAADCPKERADPPQQASQRT